MGLGGQINQTGFITLSQRKKNLVSSNVLGAAAYFGKTKMLNHLLIKLGKTYLEKETTEEQDRSEKSSTYHKEMVGYTPLMLCVAKGDENLDCVKALLNHNADFTKKDIFGNTILHIAALNGNNQMMDYIAKNLKLNIFDRNNKGETALYICQANANTEGVKIMDSFHQEYDQSKNLAESLLNELEKEDKHEEDEKAKRKQKKWRNKINKLSKQLNMTGEEVEERLAKEAEEKKENELNEERRLIEKQKADELAELKRKEELRRKIEEQNRIVA